MKLKVDYFSKWLLVLIAVAFCNMVIAQRTITGTVTDEATGEPLIGANILVVGTSTGTVTDFDGTYSLSVPEGATQLEFSYTGYSAKRVDIGASNVIDVRLSAGEILEEVVVVGYGTQRAKEVTSAVASIKEEKFNKGNVNDPAQLLQGKVPGLSISRPGGDPNDGFTIRLRGLATLGANTSPLIIIDGVIGASLANVDPQDVASIDVLKDGSAAAIYGTRASSGVIIITTKKGEAGTAKIDYNGFVTADSKIRTLPVMNAQEFISVGGANEGTSTDWIDEVTRNPISQAHNLALSGGTKNTTYRAAVSYRDQKGILDNSGFTRLNGRLNLTQKALNDRLNVSVNLSVNNRNANFGQREALRYASLYNPSAPIFVRPGDNPSNFNVGDFEQWDGYFQRTLFDYFNPRAIADQNINTQTEKTLLGSIRGEYELLPGLRLAAFYSQERVSRLGGEYSSKFSFFRGQNRNGLARRYTSDDISELVESTIEWQERLGSSGIEMRLLGGYSWQEFNFEGFGLENGNFLSDAFTFNNLNGGLDLLNGLASVISSYKNQHRLIAFFGRLNLNFNDTYFLTASLRREGSSRFGEDNKWGFFPAVSGGITLSNLFEIAGVDNLKLRAGYGVTGAIPGQSYLSLLRFGPGSNFFYNGEFIPSYGPVSNDNPDLKWERKGELNVGLDFALANYRLTGNLDYFNRNTKDLLYEAPVPVPPNLFGQTWLNVGELTNSGIELGLNYLAIDKPSFKWETGVIGTYYLQAELNSLSNENFDFGDQLYIANVGAPGLNDYFIIRVKEGRPIGEIWGPVFDGITDGGNWIFRDINGDGTFCDCNDDYTVLGNGLPDLELGWTNTFTIGNFDINFFLRGQFGHDIVNSFRIFYEPVNTLTWNRVKTDFFDPKLTDAARYSSYQVENGDFVQLNNATIGYNFRLPEGSTFRNVRLYLNGQNLFYLTDYQGIDPEARFFDRDPGDNGARPGGVNNLAPGIERRDVYFLTRSVTFGINLGF